MKKYAKIITALLLLTLCVSALCACFYNNDENDNSDNSGSGNARQMQLVILNGENAKEYTVNIDEAQSAQSDKKGLMAILAYLKEQGELTYTAEDSGYGAFLTQINELKNENGNYIYIYTDVEEDFDVSVYASQITYKGKQYTNSISNASQMQIKDNCTIVITTIKF